MIRRQRPLPPSESWTPDPLVSWLAGILVMVGAVLYFRPIIESILKPGGSYRPALTHATAHLAVPGYGSLLLLSHLALSGTGAKHSSPLSTELARTNPVLAMYLISPVIGFGLLLLSEFLSWLFTSVLGPVRKLAYFRHPIMGVHATTLIFYTLTYTHGAVTLLDRFGRPLYPLRYVHWFVSVSSLGHSVYLLLRVMPGERPAWLSAALARYLAAVPACFATGFLASYVSALVPSMLWLAASFASFWYMLHIMNQMLLLGERHPDIRRHGNAPQFFAVRVMVFIVWHGFTVVWVLAALDSVSPLAEFALYVLCDLLAKYLILFVSIASVQ